MSKINLTEEELNKLKVIADFCFFDEYQDKASFPQFEKSFGVFVSGTGISLENAFKDLCGPKKKYFTFKRLIKSFLTHKNSPKDLGDDLNKLYDSMIGDTLKGTEDTLGDKNSKGKVFTSANCKNRDLISKVSVYTDDNDVIKGIKLEYDDTMKAYLYDKKAKDLNEKLHFELDVLESEAQKNLVNQIVASNEFLFRDSITHIFGTTKDDVINFLGFMLRSGKNYCIGNPEGTPFMIAGFGQQFHYVKMKVGEKGISFFEPHYIETPRVNNSLKIGLNEINNAYLDSDELINEETCLDKITDQSEIDKYVSAAPVVSDDIEGTEEEEKKLRAGKTAGKTLSEAKPKEEKIYQEEEKKPKKSAKDLSLEDILGEKEEDLIKRQEKKRKKFKKRDVENWDGKDIEKEKATRFIGNKKNYRALMNKIDQNIKQELEREKAKEEGLIPPEGEPSEEPLERKISDKRIENIEEIEKEYNEMKTPVLRKRERKKAQKFQFNAKNAWQKLSGKLELYGSSRIIQTIGNVIKAMLLLNKDLEKENRDRIGIEKRIELYKTLEENKKIVNFLHKKSRADREQYKLNSEEKKKIKELGSIENLDLDQINQRLEAIDEYSKNVDEKTIHKKLMKIYDACIERKNELIKEEEERMKEEMIKKHKINAEKMNKTALRSRQKAKEETDQILEEQFNIQSSGKLRAGKRTSANNQKLRAAKKEAREKRLGKFEDFDKRKRKNAAMKPNPERTFLDQKFPADSVKNFTDDIFPPQTESLCPIDKYGDFEPPEDALPEDYEDWENITWKRAEDIFRSKNYQVFEDDDDDIIDEIEDDDIIQGSYLSNCYFLSSIAALCPYPDFIKKLYQNQIVTKNHAYGVYLLINGEWKLVVLDDYFPCVLNKSKIPKFCFSSANGKELWVTLIEKAWAKVNGNYINIGTGGMPHEVFPIITEAHSEMVQTPTLKASRGKGRVEDPFWNKLLRAQKNNFIMTAGTNANGDGEDLGLFSGHAYTVIKLWDLYEETGQDIKLVNLRNPWGEGEWSGDWSDYSKKWTKKIEKIVGKEEAVDNGEFFMSYEDFCKYYVTMGICHFRLDYFYTIRRIGKRNHKGSKRKEREESNENPLEGPQITKVTIPANNCDCYFRIIQNNPRFKYWDSSYQQNVLQYIMLLDSDFNYIISECNTDTFTCIRHPKLKKGTYYLITDINYRYVQDINEIEGYNISAYSNQQVELSGRLDQDVDVAEVLKNASIQMAEYIIKGEIHEDALDLTEYNLEGQTVKGESICNGKLTMYKTKAFSHRAPYQVFLFENKSSSPVGATIQVPVKGKKKNYEFYYDPDTTEMTERDVYVPGKSKEAVMIMKYNNNVSFTPKVVENKKVKASTSSGSSSKKKTPSKKVEEEEPEEIDEEDMKVFDEEGEALDDNGKVNQYFLEIDNGYLLGIENKTRSNFNMKLETDGLKIVTPREYKGKKNVTFTLKKNSKNIFKTEFIPNFNGEVYFIFESE